MAETTTNPWEELRKAFPAKSVGKIPKGSIQLDYVGHAAVTDRLISVDPLWSWEPVAFDERGLPAYDNAGGLWIRLTVNGVTRLGYGDGADPKVRIGDALRNAAMRFGVALDLWTKDELESALEDPSHKNDKPTQRPAVGQHTEAPAAPVQEAPELDEDKTVTVAQAALLLARSRDASGLTDKIEVMDWFIEQFGIAANEVRRGDLEEVLQEIIARQVHA